MCHLCQVTAKGGQGLCRQALYRDSWGRAGVFMDWEVENLFIMEIPFSGEMFAGSLSSHSGVGDEVMGSPCRCSPR